MSYAFCGFASPSPIDPEQPRAANALRREWPWGTAAAAFGTAAAKVTWSPGVAAVGRCAARR